MAVPTVQIELPDGDPSPLLADATRQLHSQCGWINLWPQIPDDFPASEGSGLFAVFGARGPAVPQCTWVAPEPKQRPPHVQLGIRHGSGTNAVGRLSAQGLVLPERWVKLSDHPKRGLVVAVAADVAPRDSLLWLMDAGRRLARAPLTGKWLVQVHG